MLNPLMLLSLLGGGAWLLAKKTTTPAYIPPPTPYGGPTNLITSQTSTTPLSPVPIVMPPLVITPNPTPQTISPQTISPGLVSDSSHWEITAWSASSGYTTLVDPQGNQYAVGPTASKANSLGGTDYYLTDGRIVRDPSKSPFYTEQSGTGDTPWSSSSTPDQTGPSAATPLSIPQLPTQLSQLPGFITSTLPGLLQQLPSISSQLPTSNPIPQTPLPSLPNIPGMPNIAGMNSTEVRGVAAQLSLLGQTALAQQVAHYADLMDQTGQATVYVQPST